MSPANINFGVCRMCAMRLAWAVMLGVLLSGLAGIANAQSRFVVTSTGDAGPGTLRDAINFANANADSTTIDFDIDQQRFGRGPWTISLSTFLPEFSAPVFVRGFSQPGSIAGSSPLSSTYRIEIDDSALGVVADLATGDHGAILTFSRGSERSTVNGLAFVGARRTGRVAILAITHDIRIVANRFGVRHNGQVSRYPGLAIGAQCAERLVIGGNRPAEGNLIGGTDEHAIMLAGADHLIGFNWIGFDTLGVSDTSADGGQPNVINGYGILAGAIGVGLPPHLQRWCTPAMQGFFHGLRRTTIRDNRISGTRRAAIGLFGNPTSGTTHNQLLNNVIGQDLWLSGRSFVVEGIRLANGAADNTLRDNLIGEARSGILLGGFHTSAGDAGTGNLITGNRLRKVSIAAIGFDVDNQFQPLPNDPLDADGGPNRRQNKPVLSVVNSNGTIEGVLESLPARAYRIEVFHSVNCPSPGVSCTENYLGAFNVSTDGAGRALFSVGLGDLSGGIVPAGGLRVNERVNATATDVDLRDTSELSDVALVRAPIPVTVTTTANAIGTPLAAMTGPAEITVSVVGSPAMVPTGSVDVLLLSATGERLLGRATLANGSATIAASPSTGSFFPQAGRFEVFARYLGDTFHAASVSTARRVVVFRPSIALRSHGLSTPIRRNAATGDLERFDVAQSLFVPLATGVTARLVDSERIATALGAISPLDLALMETSNGRATLDGAGGMLPATSGVINSGFEVLDLLQADADPRADALVRNSATGAYSIVTGVFTRVGAGERIVPLAVSERLEFATSGDFNGDGITDLVFRETSDNDALVHTLNDAAVLGTMIVSQPGADQQPATAADLNGDGYEDLIWLSSRGEVTATLMKPNEPIGNASANLPNGVWTTPGSGHFATESAMPDYGRGHLVFANTVTGEVVIWRNPQIMGTVLSVQPSTMFFDPSFVIERMR